MVLVMNLPVHYAEIDIVLNKENNVSIYHCPECENLIIFVIYLFVLDEHFLYRNS
jgi:hypothetical protein